MIKMRFPAKKQSSPRDFLEDNRSPLAIIKEISRLSARMEEEDSSCPDEGEIDRLVISEIGKRDGAVQTEICKALHLKKPTVSVAVKRLESKGYIFRETDVLDHRAARLYLTDDGEILEDVLERRARSSENVAIKELTTNERDVLIKILVKVYTNILSELE